MGRSCCIQGCKSGKIVPSHGIPTNKERRKQWLDLLNLNITDESIKQLRVCHKHFHDKDYSCSPKYRRLLNTAVPCIQVECTEDHGQEVHTQLHEQQEVLEQHAIEIERLSQQQESTEARLIQGQEDIEERMEFLYHQQEEKIAILSQKQMEMEKQLSEKNQCFSSARRRPNLLGITRQRTLNPQTRIFYHKLIKLQKDQRRLKSIVRKMKEKQRSKRIILSTTDYRGKKDMYNQAKLMATKYNKKDTSSNRNRNHTI